MIQETSSGRGRKRKPRINKATVLLTAAVLLIGTVVGSTVAYLIAQTDAVENTFEYAKVSCEVTENFNGSEKTDVKVENTGTTDAYIRATYVVNWLDSNGNIAASVPEEYRYDLTENPGGKWTKGADGYFYYLTPVAPHVSTPGSLLNCKVTCPENPEYTLSVEILADAIQSEPANAVTEAWKYTPTAASEN